MNYSGGTGSRGGNRKRRERTRRGSRGRRTRRNHQTTVEDPRSDSVADSETSQHRRENVHTTRALLRRDGVDRASGAVRTHAVVSCDDHRLPQTPDEDWEAWLLGAPSCEVDTLIEVRSYKKNRRAVTPHRGEWNVPSGWLHSSGLIGLAVLVAMRAETELAIETQLKGGRLVCLMSYIARKVERLIVQSIGPRFDRIFVPWSFAFRKGGGPIRAVLNIRANIRAGFKYVIRADIVTCFASIKSPVVEDTLRRLVPWIAPDLREQILRTMRRHIIMHPNHPGHSAEPFDGGSRNCLIEGGVLAPLVSNVVLHFWLDLPFVQEFGDRIRLVRYADDLCILARSAAQAEEARAFIVDLLDKIDLALHHGADVKKKGNGKGNEIPIDATRQPFEFVGWRVHGGSIAILRSTLDKMTARLLGAKTKRERWSHSSQIIYAIELHRGWRNQFRVVVDRLHRRDPRIGAEFIKCVEARRSDRKHHLYERREDIRAEAYSTGARLRRKRRAT